MEEREVIEIDLTNAAEQCEEVSQSEYETARILGMKPEHFNRIVQTHMNVLHQQAKARIAARKVASESRTVVD